MSTMQTQGDIWGARASDWAEIDEPMGLPMFKAVFGRAGVGQGMRLLDIGCGSGTALALARDLGAGITGLDSSPGLIALARKRLPETRFELGDMVALPFEDASFDLVTGFNSFQFASDIPKALSEARRVVRPGGHVAMLVWGLKDECQSMEHTLGPVMALMPPPPPAARPPLATPGVLEGLFTDAGLTPVAREVTDGPFLFPDAATAWRGFSSAGLMIPVTRELGEERVRTLVLDSLKPFTRADGTVLQKNRFHWVLGQRAS